MDINEIVSTIDELLQPRIPSLVMPWSISSVSSQLLHVVATGATVSAVAAEQNTKLDVVKGFITINAVFEIISGLYLKAIQKVFESAPNGLKERISKKKDNILKKKLQEAIA